MVLGITPNTKFVYSLEPEKFRFFLLFHFFGYAAKMKIDSISGDSQGVCHLLDGIFDGKNSFVVENPDQFLVFVYLAVFK